MDMVSKTPFQPSLVRFSNLLKSAGVLQTCSACVSVVEDHYLRLFDRIYGVKTSGYISLSDTSVDPSKRQHANRYGPVNAWAFQKLLTKLSLPKTAHFADLGCGLGRACILAAQYGFAKVTGVEIAPEFCLMARENVLRCGSKLHGLASIEIVQADVLEYCQEASDDVFFMYRPFSYDFLLIVLTKLRERSMQQEKSLTVIYSERLNLPEKFAKAFSQNRAFERVCEMRALGQQFNVFRCGGNPQEFSESQKGRQENV